MKLIYQILYLINNFLIIQISNYLFFRCFEVFEEERKENKKGNSQGIRTSYSPWKEDMKVEARHDTFLALTLLARKTLVLILSSAMVAFFSKSRFAGINLVI